MEDGSLPDEKTIKGMEEHLQQRSKRPLTDNVTVAAPDAVKYKIDFTYYINTSDASVAVQIQEQATQAIADYKAWQCTKIGRDINPDQLRAFLKNAGVKRVEVREPVFKVLQDNEAAILESENVVYGGLEND